MFFLTFDNDLENDSEEDLESKSIGMAICGPITFVIFVIGISAFIIGLF